MKMSGNGDNLALTLTFANEHLDFVCAHFLKVNGINSDRTYMTYEGLDTAKSVGPGGELIWSGRCEFQLPRDLISGSTWREGVQRIV